MALILALRPWLTPWCLAIDFYVGDELRFLGSRNASLGCEIGTWGGRGPHSEVVFKNMNFRGVRFIANKGNWGIFVAL